MFQMSIIVKFSELLIWIPPRIINDLRCYIKHAKECFIRFPNTLEVGLKKGGCVSFIQLASRCLEIAGMNTSASSRLDFSRSLGYGFPPREETFISGGGEGWARAHFPKQRLVIGPRLLLVWYITRVKSSRRKMFPQFCQSASALILSVKIF